LCFSPCVYDSVLSLFEFFLWYGKRGTQWQYQIASIVK
jgi:hypothetical protein